MSEEGLDRRTFLKASVATALGAAMAPAALAQTTAPAANPQAPTNPAISSKDGNNPGAPATGANSFTESQARARLESRGYTAINGLAKDKDGVWRASATKDGKSVQVAVDYQGNVVAQ